MFTERIDRMVTGVSILLPHKSIYSSHQLALDANCEIIACQLDVPNNPLFIFAAYRPSKTDFDYLNELCSLFENIYYSHPNATIWFGGYMNLPDIDWDLNTVIHHQYRSCINERFIDFLANCGLSQFVTFPTRNNNILDIFATNKPDLVTACEPLSDIGDQEAVHIRAITTIKYSKPLQRKVYLWNKVNFDQVKEEFKQFSCTYVANNSIDTNVNLLWETLRDKCLDIADHTPSKYTSIRQHQPWINHSIKQLSRRKQCHYNKARLTGLAEDWET